MTGRHNPRGNKDAQFARREVALRFLSEKTLTMRQIASSLGVAYGTVRGWSSRLNSGDSAVKTMVKRGKVLGSGKILSPKEEKVIIALIRDKQPQQLKLSFYLWSVGGVMALVKSKFNKVLSESSVRNYLKTWGFTIQRPSTQYDRRDDVVVETWLQETYPKIATQAAAEKAEIHWLDESGVDNQAVYMRGYAPSGQTPVITKPSKRERVSFLSTVTNKGKMRFRVYDGSLKDMQLIEFFEDLMKETQKKIYVVMDNLRTHNTKKITAWAELNKTRIALVYLPPYAPDLNPDEYLNNDLKQNVHRHTGLSQTYKALKSKTIAYLRHIQKKPEKVKGYFQTPKPLYAA
jgi:transposase